MNTSTLRNGWDHLSNGFDVEFRNSIPIRLSDNGMGVTEPDPSLIEEIAALGKLHVYPGDWAPGERPDEHEARLYVSSREFTEVLRRLAQASAALFVDRYHKPVDDTDVDWDRLEYLKDFLTALNHCGLEPGDKNPDNYRDSYVEVMHQETRKLAQSQEPPLVAPE